jgi:hypothetical protein
MGTCPPSRNRTGFQFRSLANSLSIALSTSSADGFLTAEQNTRLFFRIPLPPAALCNCCERPLQNRRQPHERARNAQTQHARDCNSPGRPTCFRCWRKIFPSTLSANQTLVNSACDQVFSFRTHQQELDSIEAIQSRSAEMSKVAAMRELAGLRQKRLATAITTQEAVVIKIGGQASNLAEQLWWTLHTEAVTQAEREFSRLFYHAYESPEVLSKFKSVTLLSRLRPPDSLRTGAIDVKLTRCRQLRTAANRLKEFSTMTFEEVSAELEAQDSEARARAQQIRQIGSELSSEPGN